MRATRILLPALLAGCSNLARVLPDAPTGEPPARPPEALRTGGAPPAATPALQRLANGLEIVLLAERGEPRVALELRFAVGVRDEDARSAGAAALFARTLGAAEQGELARTLEQAGASVVGQAELDHTRLVALAPVQHLPALLALAAEDLSGPLLDEPRATPARAAPDPGAERLLWAALYPVPHPYHPLEAEPAATSAERSAARAAFVRARFVPGAARLVLVGGFEPEAARAAIERAFGGLAPAPPAARSPGPTSPLAAPLRLEAQVAGERTRLALVWPSPARLAPGDAELELVAALLAEGPQARLGRRLVLETRLAHAVSVSQQAAELGSLFRIEVELAPGAELAAVERAALAVLAEFVEHGPTRAELEQACARAEARCALRLANPLARAAAVHEYLRAFGRPDAFARDRARWSAATPASVQSAARRVLTAPHVTLALRPRE